MIIAACVFSGALFFFTSSSSAFDNECPNMEAMLGEGIPAANSLRCNGGTINRVNLSAQEDLDMSAMMVEGPAYPESIITKADHQVHIFSGDNPSMEDMIAEGPAYE